jgi:hypothetical protein
VRFQLRTSNSWLSRHSRDKAAKPPRLLGLALVACAAAFAQSPIVPDDDPVDVLVHLRDQVLDLGQRIPNYTCIETVQRDRYDPVDWPGGKSCDALLARRKQRDFPALLILDTTDRLRLDVLLATDREVYSWAGAKRFEDGEIDKLIPEGAMGTGLFAALLLSVFQVETPRFVFAGDTALNGRRLFEYSYTVSVDESHYRVKAGKQWIISGYTGSLPVDPQTAELVRFSVRSEELPAATSLCEVDSTMEYGKVALGGIDYLVPTATRERFISRVGSEEENNIAFTSCREYLAESTVEFGASTPGTGRASVPSPDSLRLPAGLPVIVDITTAIDSDRAAAGDRIEGRLAEAVQDAHGTTLVPEGAVLEGRLMRVETHHATALEGRLMGSHNATSQGITIALRWETLAINGAKVPLSLRPSRRLGDSDAAAAATGLHSRGMEIDLPKPNESRYGVYHFSGERRVVQSGFRTKWSTAGP